MNLDNIIKSIYRYPIKGFCGELLSNVLLLADNVIPGDREYAFARSEINFDPNNPHYIKKTKFLALVKYEKLALLEAKFNNYSKRLLLSEGGIKLIEGNLTNQEDCQKISNFLKRYLNLPSSAQPNMVRARGGTKFHSFSDVPDKAISLINLSTVDELSSEFGTKIDYRRFRSNIYFENKFPWEEFNWIDHKLRIGEAVVKIIKRTKRCGATNVNPLSAVRDINIPLELKKHYKHTDLGIYAIVEESGAVNVGDTIQIL